MLSQASAGLFFDPGLGKTSTVLAAFKILKDKGLVKRMLVVAPLRVCYSVWPREIEKWSNFHDLTYAVIHDTKKQEHLDMDVDIHIINPDGLRWLYDPKARRWREWDILCVDESTMFKDSQTARFKLMRHHFPRFRRRWILTGTPVPNGALDLFGQTFILDLGRALGRFITHYRNEFFYTLAWREYDYMLKEGSFDRILDRIDPLLIRLKAEDWLRMPKLPPPTDIYVDMPPKIWEFYKELDDEFLAEWGEDVIIAANAAVAGGKLRQVANGALYTDSAHNWKPLHNAKLEALDSLLAELQGAPTLVMYEFNHDLQRLLQRYGSDTPVIGAGTDARTADQYIQSFNRGEIPVMFCQPGSMAHGLNLQEACNHIIWFGLTWNYEHYEQAIARIYRQGQKEESVFVYRIIARGTKDEDVVKTLNDKEEFQDGLLEKITEK
jgi:SNF2 family DNA or RNA helicase